MGDSPDSAPPPHDGRPAFPPPPYPPFSPPADPPPPKRGRGVALAVAIVASVAVLATAVAIPLLDDGVGITIGGSAQEPAAANLDDVEVVETTNTTHTRQEVDYDQSPPVGGPHNPVWLDCGVYDAPVPNENVVHDLEHGTVWVTYRPDLAEEDVESLAAALPQNGILSPYVDLQAPVVVTVWGTRLELTGAEDPRLPLFIERYGAGETAPEPMASCAGGLRNPPPIRGAGTAV